MKVFRSEFTPGITAVVSQSWPKVDWLEQNPEEGADGFLAAPGDEILIALRPNIQSFANC
jgi:hypothetical protein